jgi:ADP-heptose:LPS heptosyltransferase
MLLTDAPPRTIAILRALQLGDLLCSVPAWRALRAACPQARITLVGLPWARDLVDRLHCLDDFIAFPGHPGIDRSGSIVLLTGTRAEAPVVGAVTAAIRSHAIDLSGRSRSACSQCSSATHGS